MVLVARASNAKCKHGSLEPLSSTGEACQEHLTRPLQCAVWVGAPPSCMLLWWDGATHLHHSPQPTGLWPTINSPVAHSLQPTPSPQPAHSPKPAHSQQPTGHPDAHQMPPRCTQMHPGAPQMPSRCPPDAPGAPRCSPTWPPGAPHMAPSCPQVLHSWPQMPPGARCFQVPSGASRCQK